MTGLEVVTLVGGLVYRMDVFSLHESLPVERALRRTVVRINVPGLGVGGKELG